MEPAPSLQSAGSGGAWNLAEVTCGPTGHVCSRDCHYELLMGNVHCCQSSGTLHVCDQNCEQSIPYDRYTMVCRLSKKTFPRTDVEMGAESRCVVGRLAPPLSCRCRQAVQLVSGPPCAGRRKRSGEDVQPFDATNKRQQ